MVRTLTVHKSTICDISRLSLSLSLSLFLSLSLSLSPSFPFSFVRFEFKKLDNEDRFWLR